VNSEFLSRLSRIYQEEKEPRTNPKDTPKDNTIDNDMQPSLEAN